MMRWFGGVSFQAFKKSIEETVMDVTAKALVLKEVELPKEEEAKLKREIYNQAKLLKEVLQWYEQNEKNIKKAIKKAKEVLNNGDVKD